MAKVWEKLELREDLPEMQQKVLKSTKISSMQAMMVSFFQKLFIVFEC
jgi:hypothetical protein